MKAKSIVTLIVVLLTILSCDGSYRPDIDPSSILPAEPSEETQSAQDQFRSLLDTAIDSTYCTEDLSPLEINCTEEESFRLGKQNGTYYIYGENTDINYDIIFDTYGYPTVSNTGYERVDISLNADSTVLTLTADSTVYTYRRK